MNAPFDVAHAVRQVTALRGMPDQAAQACALLGDKLADFIATHLPDGHADVAGRALLIAACGTENFVHGSLPNGGMTALAVSNIVAVAGQSLVLAAESDGVLTKADERDQVLIAELARIAASIRNNEHPAAIRDRIRGRIAQLREGANRV